MTELSLTMKTSPDSIQQADAAFRRAGLRAQEIAIQTNGRPTLVRDAKMVSLPASEPKPDAAPPDKEVIQ
jgi:hypothetical protein